MRSCPSADFSASANAITHCRGTRSNTIPARVGTWSGSPASNLRVLPHLREPRRRLGAIAPMKKASTTTTARHLTGADDIGPGHYLRSRWLTPLETEARIFEGPHQAPITGASA